MAKLRYLFRNEKWSSGRVGFMSTRVFYCDNGIDMLRYFVPFDQMDWKKADSAGISEYKYIYDPVDDKVYDRLNPLALSGASGVHNLYRRFVIPRNFGQDGLTPTSTIGKFPPGSLVGLTYASGPITSLTISLRSGGVADPTVNLVSIAPGVSGSYVSFSLSPSGVYLPGQFCTLVITYTSIAVGTQVRIADVLLRYLSARGNV